METDNIQLPPLSLLVSNGSEYFTVSDEEIADNKEKLLSVLMRYDFDYEKIEVTPGPSVSTYLIACKGRIKKSDYDGIQKDVPLAIPHRLIMKKMSYGIAIEISNRTPAIVSLKYVLESEVFKNSKAELPVSLGVTIDGKARVTDIAEMPHLLIAGATKQGKTNFLKAIIMSLLYSKNQSQVKFVIIAPKMTELSLFSRLPKNCFAATDSHGNEADENSLPIVTTAQEAEDILMTLCAEMDRRYALITGSNIRNIKSYNKENPEQTLPYIVVIIDEYADLIMHGNDKTASTMSSNIKKSIISLVQKGRAAGIHIVMTTQRPSTNIIDGLVKTNFPTRVVFRVVSRLDSNTIIDYPGAEKLNGNGDMLYYAGTDLERIQCPLVTDEEIIQTVEYLKGQTGPEYCDYYLLPDKSAAKQETAPATNEHATMFSCKDKSQKK